MLRSAYLQFRLRKALGDLIYLYMDFETVWTPREMDVGDQTWWMGFWPDYYLLTGDEKVRDYVYRWRDAYVAHLQSDGGRFHHGYVRYGDIDHQNEDLVRLLMRLWLMDREDPKNRYALEEMAEHLGNWVSGIPEWYDWEQHLWKSFWLGTERIGKPVKDNGYGFNWMLVLCLESYLATGNRRYLDLAKDWNFFNYILAWEVADVFFPTVGRQYGATNCIADVYEVRSFRSNGDVGLPDTVAALYSPKPGDLRDRSILLYNAADEPQRVKIVPVSYPHKGISRFDTDAKATMASDRKSLMVELPRKGAVSVRIQL